MSAPAGICDTKNRKIRRRRKRMSSIKCKTEKSMERKFEKAFKFRKKIIGIGFYFRVEHLFAFFIRKST